MKRTYLLFFLLTAACPSDDDIVCGDGMRAGSEVCDLDDLNGATCDSQGFVGGTLRCGATCDAYDTAACGAPATCGNGMIDDMEQCDGAALADATCTSLGLGEGTLRCASNCGEYDRSGCGAPLSCGNNARDEGETCDGSDLGGATCSSVAGEDGTLACASNCLAYDTAGCGACACETGPCGSNGQCACDRPPFGSEERVPFDELAVQLTGEVTLNGATMPNDEQVNGNERGALLFVEKTTQHTVRVELGERGAAEFAVALFASTYDVILESASEDAQSALPPEQRTLLAEDLQLTESGARTFNVEDVRLSGEFTLNGATVPNDEQVNGANRGALLFIDQSTEYVAPRVELGERGAAEYSTWLFAADYTVLIDTLDEDAQSALPPQQRTLLFEGRLGPGNASRSFNVEDVRLTGEFTLNGATVPNDEQVNGSDRGALLFIDQSTEYVAPRVELGERGAAEYSTWLFAADYTVLIDTLDEDAQSALPPQQRTLLFEGRLGPGNASRSFNVEDVRLSGEFTLNGATVPNDEQVNGSDRGALLFIDQSTAHTAPRVELGERGAAEYSTWLFAADYTVLIDTLDEDAQSALPPEQRTRLFEGRLGPGNMGRSFNVEDVRLSGEFTLNGATVPNDEQVNGANRGALLFIDQSTAHTAPRVELGERGAAEYSTWLFAADYTVLIDTLDEDAQSALPPEQRKRITLACDN